MNSDYIVSQELKATFVYTESNIKCFPNECNALSYL